MSKDYTEVEAGPHFKTCLVNTRQLNECTSISLQLTTRYTKQYWNTHFTENCVGVH